jgi:class 3 adenylate cyclase
MHASLAMDATHVKRRLTSILATDAVGFSRQTSVDEEGTLRVLAAHRAVIDGIIAFHEGRIVGTAGDSVLAEFGSPVEAVRCAVEIQEALKTRNDSLPEEKRLQFRVGVNLGDVVVKNDDLLGDGVNVAARLESIAEPGGVCISSSVYDQITGKLNLGFQDIGEQTLKNISRPIRAYRLAGTGTPARLPAAAARPPGGARAFWPAAVAIGVALLGYAAWEKWLASDFSRRDPVPPVATAARSEDQGKLKAATDEAIALRARMEEELQRARGDAESMKRAAEAELARARAEADASRSARIKADAEAAASRIKEEANVLKRAAEADAARAAQARREAEAEAEKARAAPARKAAESTQIGGTTVAAPVVTGTAVLASGLRTYDGNWTVTRTCENFRELDAFTDRFVTTVRDDELAIEHGARGQPGYLTLRGSVAPDGAVTLKGTMIARSKQYYGRTTPASFSGTLAGATPILTGGWGDRRCTFTFTRAK